MHESNKKNRHLAVGAAGSRNTDGAADGHSLCRRQRFPLLDRGRPAWTNQGYRSEKDGVWYLFLPADESLADTVLSFSGSVTAASAGTLDREHGTLTGAFAASDG